MVCLVGENPLPVYLSIRQFAAEGAQIILVCSKGSKGTRPHADRIKQRIADHHSTEAWRVQIQQIEDPFSPASVLSIFDSLTGEAECALHMTGGTKIMAAFSVLSWKDRLQDVIYLAETNGRFWFGDGSYEELDPIRLNVRELCRLHGIRLLDDTSWTPDPSPDDLKNVFAACCANPLPRFSHSEEHTGGSAEKNFEWFEKDKPILDQCIKLLTPKTQDAWCSIERINNANDYDGSNQRRIFEFFALNQWLEYIVRELVLCIPSSDAPTTFGQRPVMPCVAEDDLLFSQEFIVGRPVVGGHRYDPKQFEGDILAVVNNRLRYISVTTSRHPSRCKEKMFEAMHRARQIGGDLASSCVVSMASRSTVEGCRASIGEDPRHTIFGQDHLKYWMHNDLTVLRQFLTQNFV